MIMALLNYSFGVFEYKIQECKRHKMLLLDEEKKCEDPLQLEYHRQISGSLSKTERSDSNGDFDVREGPINPF